MNTSFASALCCLAFVAILSGCQAQHDAPTSNPPSDSLKASSWCGVLSPDAYRVLREQGTEPRFSGEFWLHDEDGVYVCMGCGAQLFDSGAKFKSNSGWPSFYEPSATTGVEERMDLSHGMRRMEVVCNACGGHLGHVFEDGPPPTGLRSCINSVALDCQTGGVSHKKRGPNGDLFFDACWLRAPQRGRLQTNVKPSL